MADFLNSPILVQQSKSFSLCGVAFSCVEYCVAEKIHRAGQSLRSVDVFITLIGFAAFCCFWVHRTPCYKPAATMVCPLVGAENTQYWPPCLSSYLNIWRFDDIERCSRGKRFTSTHFCAVKLGVDFTLIGSASSSLRPTATLWAATFRFVFFFHTLLVTKTKSAELNSIQRWCRVSKSGRVFCPFRNGCTFFFKVYFVGTRRALLGGAWREQNTTLLNVSWLNPIFIPERHHFHQKVILLFKNWKTFIFGATQCK